MFLCQGSYSYICVESDLRVDRLHSNLGWLLNGYYSEAKLCVDIE